MKTEASWRELLQHLSGVREGGIGLQGFLISLNCQRFLSLLSVVLPQTIIKNRTLRMQFHGNFQYRDGVIESFGIAIALRIFIQVSAGEPIRVELQRFPKVIDRLSQLSNDICVLCNRAFGSAPKQKIGSPTGVRSPVLRIKIKIELRGFRTIGAGLKARVPNLPNEIRIDVRAGKELLKFFPKR